MVDMKIFTLTFLLSLSSLYGCSQVDKVELTSYGGDTMLLVNGEPFMVKGMNWDYYPIGTNYTYNLWEQPDETIRAALDKEMTLLKSMGVNAIRQYNSVPPEWISYIYEQYGIFTMLNHPFGRYGLMLDGKWKANTDYADPQVRKVLLNEIAALAETYKNTPGLLFYLLGNENNYGLFWDGAATEDLPEENPKHTARARSLYRLLNDAAALVKKIDPAHPVAICNGDLLFLEIIAEQCPDIDIFGTNMYRGISFGDAFKRVKDELGKPIVFTELGCDAFDAIHKVENQSAQAHYLAGNWKEIYQNAPGLGSAGNSIGGFSFQFSDGWWKHGQTTNLDVHDTSASWSNGGYQFDYKEGENNMNEEWFGVCAKGPADENGLYELFPRTAFFVLKEIHAINPFSTGTTLQSIENDFAKIDFEAAAAKAKNYRAALHEEGKTHD